jgi:CelD/BcsL family acetyltransferase involved in cellulose biosynthesis
MFLAEDKVGSTLMHARNAAIIAFVLLAPSAAHAAPAAPAAIPCADIPAAQHFVDNLRPGPNTRAAQHHLEAAKHATSEQQCSAELAEVDKYARRSRDADKRLASSKGQQKAAPAPQQKRVPAPQCADALHQNRPGGSDYHGPPVAGCP